MTERIPFSTLLKQYRLEAGLTQEALAERAFVSAKSIGSLERDRSRLPRLETVRVLAEALALDEPSRERLLLAARPAGPATGEPSWSTRTLPRRSTPLYGRERELDQVERVLADAFDGVGTRLIVITGPGGVGKTSLALAVADRYGTRLEATPIFVDLTSIADSSSVVDAVARQLGMSDRDVVPLQTRLVARLRQQPHLLLLDNAEHLPNVRNALLTLLDECPELVLLVTSRVTLGLRAERRVRLKPLAIPAVDATAADLVQAPSVALFLDRARAAGWEGDSTDDLATIGAICRRLDGLPLAIELAAAWADLFTPIEFLRRIEERLPVLVRGRRDMPARHQTMQAAIGWSIDLLDAAIREQFARVCIFENGADLVSVCVLLGSIDGARVCEQQLAELVDHSLIEWHRSAPDDDSRLRILETIREFGLDLLKESGDLPRVAELHSDLMQELAERQIECLGGAEEADALRRLDRWYPNVRAALSRCIAEGDSERSRRFVATLWPYWLQTGALAEGSARADEAFQLAEWESSSNRDTWIGALSGAALISIERGDLESASRLVERVLAETESATATRRPAIVAYSAGLLATQRGDLAHGQSLLEDALEGARGEADHRIEIAALGALASVAFQTGAYEQSASLEAERLARCAQVGDRRGMSASQKNLAFQAMFSGRFEDASQLGNQAAALLREIGDTGILAEVLWALGHLAYLRGALDDAAMLLTESRTMRQARGDELNAAKSTSALAVVEFAQGNHLHARALAESADRPLREQHDAFGLAMNSLVRAHIELAAGNNTESRPLLTEGGRMLLEMNNLLYLPWCLEGLARISAGDGDWSCAAELSGARSGLSSQMGTPIPPLAPVSIEQIQAEALRELGEATFRAMFERGAENPMAVVRACLHSS